MHGDHLLLSHRFCSCLPSGPVIFLLFGTNLFKIFAPVAIDIKIIIAFYGRTAEHNGTLLRASVVVQEKVLRIVGTDPDSPQGFLQLFGCGRQRKPKALFALLITLSVMKQDRKHFAHLVAPF